MERRKLTPAEQSEFNELMINRLRRQKATICKEHVLRLRPTLDYVKGVLSKDEIERHDVECIREYLEYTLAGWENE